MEGDEREEHVEAPDADRPEGVHHGGARDVELRELHLRPRLLLHPVLVGAGRPGHAPGLGQGVLGGHLPLLLQELEDLRRHVGLGHPACHQVPVALRVALRVVPVEPEQAPAAAQQGRRPAAGALRARLVQAVGLAEERRVVVGRQHFGERAQLRAEREDNGRPRGHEERRAEGRADQGPSVQLFDPAVVLLDVAEERHLPGPARLQLREQRAVALARIAVLRGQRRPVRHDDVRLVAQQAPRRLMQDVGPLRVVVSRRLQELEGAVGAPGIGSERDARPGYDPSTRSLVRRLADLEPDLPILPHRLQPDRPVLHALAHHRILRRAADFKLAVLSEVCVCLEHHQVLRQQLEQPLRLPPPEVVDGLVVVAADDEDPLVLSVLGSLEEIDHGQDVSGDLVAFVHGSGFEQEVAAVEQHLPLRQLYVRVPAVGVAHGDEADALAPLIGLYGHALLPRLPREPPLPGPEAHPVNEARQERLLDVVEVGEIQEPAVQDHALVDEAPLRVLLVVPGQLLAQLAEQVLALHAGEAHERLEELRQRPPLGPHVVGLLLGAPAGQLPLQHGGDVAERGQHLLQVCQQLLVQVHPCDDAADLGRGLLDRGGLAGPARVLRAERRPAGATGDGHVPQLSDQAPMHDGLLLSCHLHLTSFGAPGPHPRARVRGQCPVQLVLARASACLVSLQCPAPESIRRPVPAQILFVRRQSRPLSFVDRSPLVVHAVQLKDQDVGVDGDQQLLRRKPPADLQRCVAQGLETAHQMQSPLAGVREGLEFAASSRAVLGFHSVLLCMHPDYAKERILHRQSPRACALRGMLELRVEALVAWISGKPLFEADK
mmetsp:Transcript_82829/g.242846  ORF Transcript_82829/g.242846 Transcript_82829/m.242846 type:complete len:832 (-) Transcript_82829:91-2586(-)